MAKLTFSFAAWKEARVQPSVIQIPVVDGKSDVATR
jgi:hypothetical protein